MDIVESVQNTLDNKYVQAGMMAIGASMMTGGFMMGQPLIGVSGIAIAAIGTAALIDVI